MPLICDISLNMELLGSVGEKYKSCEIVETEHILYDNRGHKISAIKIRCACGIDKIVRLGDWKLARIGSCGRGCQFSTSRKQDPIITSAKTIFRTNYQDGNLTFEMFYLLSQQNCFYCGKSPSNKWNSFSTPSAETSSQFSIENGMFIYNGLDRINSFKPHNLDNVVSACINCNRAKAEKSQEEFIQWIIQVNNFCKKKSNACPKTAQLLQYAENQGITIPTKISPNINDVSNKYGSLTVLSTFRKNKKTWVNCICDCGSPCIKGLGHLKEGATRSCGQRCPYCPIRKRHPLITLANRIFISVGYNDGDLTVEQFYMLSQLDCWYCGKPAINSNIVKRYKNNHSIYHYNGLDRFDNNQKHIINNVVPCCIEL